MLTSLCAKSKRTLTDKEQNQVFDLEREFIKSRSDSDKANIILTLREVFWITDFSGAPFFIRSDIVS
jgi:hypothetical protein